MSFEGKSNKNMLKMYMPINLSGWVYGLLISNPGIKRVNFLVNGCESSG